MKRQTKIQYPGTGDHNLETKADDGSIIVLEDGSIWAVEASDQATAAPWTDATAITVNETEGSNYELVNTDDHEIVHANYIRDE